MHSATKLPGWPWANHDVSASPTWKAGLGESFTWTSRAFLVLWKLKANQLQASCSRNWGNERERECDQCHLIGSCIWERWVSQHSQDPCWLSVIGMNTVALHWAFLHVPTSEWLKMDFLEAVASDVISVTTNYFQVSRLAHGTIWAVLVSTARGGWGPHRNALHCTLLLLGPALQVYQIALCSACIHKDVMWISSALSSKASKPCSAWVSNRLAKQGASNMYIYWPSSVHISRQSPLMRLLQHNLMTVPIERAMCAISIKVPI